MGLAGRGAIVGTDTPAIAFSRVAEVTAVVRLGAFVAARLVARVPMPRW
jgi:hypothetical protein